MKPHKIVIAGGTGFLGDVLIKAYSNTDTELVILSRKATFPPAKNIRYAIWDGKTLNTWKKELDGCDVLINLAGKSVNCRYTPENKDAIFSSRVDSTNILGEAINQCSQAPALWINSSSATIYKHSEDKANDELTGETSNTFSERVCQTWEKTFFEHPTNPTVRKIALRTAIVLGTEGGVYPVLASLVKRGLGGAQGKGTQYVSWLHSDDFIGIIEYLIQEKDLSGAINACSPNPVRNETFMKYFRESLHIPIGLPTYSWMLKIGVVLMNTEEELVIKSRRVIPGILQNHGFKFQFEQLEEALKSLAQKA